MAIAKGWTDQKTVFKRKPQNSFFSVSETMHKGTEALEPVSFCFQPSLTHLTSAAAPGEEVELLAFVHRFLSWLCFSITTSWLLAPRTAGAHRARTTVHKHHKKLCWGPDLLCLLQSHQESKKLWYLNSLVPSPEYSETKTNKVGEGQRSPARPTFQVDISKVISLKHC